MLLILALSILLKQKNSRIIDTRLYDSKKNNSLPEQRYLTYFRKIFIGYHHRINTILQIGNADLNVIIILHWRRDFFNLFSDNIIENY